MFPTLKTTTTLYLTVAFGLGPISRSLMKTVPMTTTQTTKTTSTATLALPLLATPANGMLDTFR